MSTIPSKFSTRRLVLNYKATDEQCNDYLSWRTTFDKVMQNLFGVACKTSNSLYVFFVPASCDFIEIDAAMSREFAKYPILKGMRFRLQLHDEMVVV